MTRSIPFLTTEQMREVDRAMVEDYRIELIQMMENAGRNLAVLARRRFFEGDPRGRRVVVLAGSGGNGGGALVASRHLANWGAQVEVITTRAPERFLGIPAHQIAILKHLGIPIRRAEDREDCLEVDLILDAIVGYGLTGPPQGAAATLIRWANEKKAPLLSLDVPSGLDASSGRVYDPTARATATMTLALPKVGLAAEAAKEFVGELYLADIGVPPILYRGPHLDLEVGAIFAEAEILRIE